MIESPSLMGSLESGGGSPPPKEETMEIHWSHDIDAVLADAARQQKPALLDFSAAPM